MGGFSVIFMAMKIFTWGADFYTRINTELLVLGLGIGLLFLSKILEPKIQKTEQGRTVTKKL